MKTTVIFKTDKKRKVAAQRLAKKMGLPFSTVMTKLMDEFVSREHISFSAQSYEPTPYLRKILEQGEKDLKTGKNIKHFDSVDALFDDLNARTAKAK
jgi:addiction module RelB/DinJ family antitoxin